MKTNLDDIRNEIIDYCGEKSEKFGLTPVAGQLEGLLLLRRAPMSLDDMASYLDVSKAAVSTNIRLLERWKVVRRVYNRGDRKNYYEIRGDLWEIETEIISTIVKDEIEKFSTLLGRLQSKLQGIAATGDDEKQDVAFVTDRLNELDDYLDAVEHLMNVLLKPGRVTSANIKKITIA